MSYNCRDDGFFFIIGSGSGDGKGSDGNILTIMGWNTMKYYKEFHGPQRMMWSDPLIEQHQQVTVIAHLPKYDIHDILNSFKMVWFLRWWTLMTFMITWRGHLLMWSEMSQPFDGVTCQDKIEIFMSPVRINCINFGDPSNFSPPSSQNVKKNWSSFLFMTKYLQN